MLKVFTIAIALFSVIVYIGFNYFQPKVKTPGDLRPKYDYIISKYMNDKIFFKYTVLLEFL